MKKALEVKGKHFDELVSLDDSLDLELDRLTLFFIEFFE